MQREIRPITTHEFSLFRTLVEGETGIHLTEVKQALVNARLLARIRELGFRTFSDYYDRVTQGPAEELTYLINAICTNETQFFREPNQFSLLESSLIPRWLDEAEHGLRRRRIRVWSAACSSGEEPYSVAMLLFDRLPKEWTIEILATDLSTKALGKATNAVYPMPRLADIPLDYRQAFLLRGVREQEGKFRVAEAIRNLVEFRRFNLIGDVLPPSTAFDLVLCRNVLMYFHQETRRKVVRRLVERLAYGGHLCVGHSESLHDYHPRLRTVVPTVYQLVEEAD